MTAIPMETLVTVFGGSGFLGRHVVRALAQLGYRIRVAVRRPDLAGYLQPLGRVGQIHAVQANVRHQASVEAAVRDADVVVNLVGILFERGRQRFDAVQALRRRAGGAAPPSVAGARLIHVSAIGADEHSPSGYARAKAEGEKAVLAATPAATILRPSIMFGPEDNFFNKFAAMARISPALPLIGGGHTQFQPVFAGDVASAVVAAIEGRAQAGHDLRARRAGGAELQRADAIRARHHRAPPPPCSACRLRWRSCRRPSCNVCRSRCSRPIRSSCSSSDNVVSDAPRGGPHAAGLGIDPTSMEHRSVVSLALSPVRQFAQRCRGRMTVPVPDALHAQDRDSSGYRAVRRNPSCANLVTERQRDQPERADDDAPPGEQREAVALHVAEERLHHDPGADERHREADRDR